MFIKSLTGIANAFASTLPKPHEPTLQPKLCQRACKANPREEFQNFSPRLKEKKIKTRQHTGDTDSKENETYDKFNMKVQFDTDTWTDKNRQCITGGIFYCRRIVPQGLVGRYDHWKRKSC